MCRAVTDDKTQEVFEEAGDHAGELETALGLAFFPDLVAKDPETGKLAADDGAVTLWSGLEVRPNRAFWPVP